MRWIQPIRALLGRPIPIIVYQMGKVGSSSVQESLHRCGYKPVYHLHRMNPAHIQRIRAEYAQKNQPPPDDSLGEKLYAEIIQSRRPAHFITLVREPIGRNISAYFQNLTRFSASSVSIDAQIDAFLRDYPHDVPLTWFDDEVKPVLGIDVYSEIFPLEKGWIRFQNGPFELLLLRIELEDALKEKVIRDFIQRPDFKLINANAAESKEYADRYREFTHTIRLPESYIEKMCSAKYTRHFYSADEIEKIRAKWTR